MQNILLEKIQEIILSQISIDKLIKKYSKAQADKSAWETKWNLISSQILPDMVDYSPKSPNTTNTPRTSKISNHCGIISGIINKIVSYINSQLADPSSRWLEMRFESKLDENLDALKWLYECKEALYKVFSASNSNFYPSSFSFHHDWFTLGTSCREIIIREDTGDIRFNVIPMSAIAIELSGHGDIKTVYRKFSLDAEKAYDLWGNNLSEKTLQELKSDKTPSCTKEYFEVAMPNPLINEMPLLKYISIVIDKRDKKIVDFKMHHQLPYIVSRFLVASGETYGRSYTWYAMPDMATINQTSQRIIQGVDYSVYPVNVVQDENTINPRMLTPGAFVPGLDINGNLKIRQMSPIVNLQIAVDFYGMKVKELRESLVVTDVFPDDNPRMTAEESRMRHIQHNHRLRPVLVRLEREDLSLTVTRTLILLQQLGKLPEFPYEQIGITPEELPNPLLMLKIMFSGQLSKLQRMEELNNSDAFLQKLFVYAQLNPEVKDIVNTDNMAKNDAIILGVTPNDLNTPEVINAIRESRAEQQRQQSEIEQGQIAADMAVKLKDAGVGIT